MYRVNTKKYLLNYVNIFLNSFEIPDQTGTLIYFDILDASSKLDIIRYVINQYLEISAILLSME